MSDHNRWDIIAASIFSTTEEIWECGCFEGDIAKQMAEYADPRRVIRVFDTFAGQPFAGGNDFHKVGSMKSDEDSVVKRLAQFPNVHIRKGVMPETFAGLEDSVISVVNIDVDNERSVRECLEWLYPRVHSGGCIIIDDYNCSACPGAKMAVDAFMAAHPEEALRAPGGPVAQAYFIKK